ncbi:MAG: M23 family metallopeptidase [Bacteroidales bacterium]|nr:M23 family metallopeptidase [Bacteroidales bacterium]
MRRTISLIFIQFLMLYSIGQDGITFHPPVKIPIYLSGNFGEIRSDHFHSGIDIKTQGTIGHHVFSIDDGYISRIKVQTNGYGKSIYITHPNGFTSVYGHLDRYRDDIAAYVNSMQYKQQSHMVDLYLKQETFPLERGEFIAYSGNTGGSSGPHLHFEIRSSSNQHPTNVLNYNFDIKDRVAPRFHSLHLYPMDNRSHLNGKSEKFSIRVVKDNGIYTIPYGTKIDGSGTLGISVEVFDYLDGASNRCGVHTLEMYVDNKLSYSHVMDEFSFSETRYINAHTDYEERIRSGIKAHRLHRLPNDRLRIYNKSVDNQALVVDESRRYPIRIVATDVAGNSSVLEFSIQGSNETVAVPDTDTGNVTTMKYNKANSFEEGPVRVDIPANALYQNMDFTFSISPQADGSLTPFYHIASREVPVHSSYTLSIKSPSIDPTLYKKLLLISHNDDNEVESAGGEYRDGAVVAKLRNFGEYSVALDTIAPEIIPLNNSKRGDYSGRKQLRFTILDDLSGIENYEGYIDNQWALFEYDPKSNLLLYKFDLKRITKGSAHELELYVVDKKGNVNLLHTTFNW